MNRHLFNVSGPSELALPPNASVIDRLMCQVFDAKVAMLNDVGDGDKWQTQPLNELVRSLDTAGVAELADRLGEMPHDEVCLMFAKYLSNEVLTIMKNTLRSRLGVPM